MLGLLIHVSKRGPWCEHEGAAKYFWFSGLHNVFHFFLLQSQHWFI